MTTSNKRLSGRENSQRSAALSGADAPASAARRRAACTHCGVCELYLPCSLLNAELGRLDQLVYARLKVSRGEDLCRAGDPSSAIYAIRSGFFKSERVLEDGRCQVMSFHMPGDIIGMDGIELGRYTCSAVTLADAEVCVVPLQRLEDLLPEVHALQRVFHQILGREIVRGHGSMVLLGVMQADQRLAAFLLNLLQRFESRGRTACSFELPMTREDIGSFLGLKLETVSRLFSKLRDSALLAVEQRHIRILDPAGLRQIVAQRPVRDATRQHTPAGQLMAPMPRSLIKARRDCGPSVPQPRKGASMNILALILAGGEGTRLHPLTATHAKPALPFVNGYRIIDFVLSNLLNSGVSSVYVLAQYKPESLIDHLHAVWVPRFNGKGGFLTVVCPNTVGEQESFKGTAHAVYRNSHLVNRHKPDLVAVFAADHVYRMDIGQMADFHRECNADVSVAAVPVPIERAPAFGIIRTADDGSICEFQEKPLQPAAMPAHPALAYASMGNYLFEPRVLADLLEEANRSGGSDFGRHIMPRLPGGYRAFAYDFSSNALPGVAAHEEPGYWRDVGTLEALVAARKDTQGRRPRFDLRNHAWPIVGREHQARTIGERKQESRSRVWDNAQVNHATPVFQAACSASREQRPEQVTGHDK